MPFEIPDWLKQAPQGPTGERQGNVFGYLDPRVRRGLTPEAATRLRGVPVEMGAQMGREYYDPQAGVVRTPSLGIGGQRWLHEGVHALDPAVSNPVGFLGSGSMGWLPSSERERLRAEYVTTGLADQARYWLNQNEEQFAMTAQRVAELPIGANPRYATPGRGIQPRYQQYYRNIFTPELMRPTRQDPRAWATRGVRTLPPQALPGMRQLAQLPRQQSTAQKE